MSQDPITDYMAELRRHLRWRRHKRRVLAEVEDHLRAAAATHEGQGMGREDAARTAISQLGPLTGILDDAPHSRWRVVVVAALVGAVLVALVGVAHPWSGRTGAAAGAGRVRPVARGGSWSQNALLTQIVSDVRLNRRVSVTVGAPPRAFQGGARSWVSFSIPPSDRAATILGEWKDALVMGTFRDLAKQRGLVSVAGYTEGHQGAGVVGDAGLPALTAKPTQESVAVDVRRAGLSPESVQLLHPGEGTAVLVTATTPDAAKFLSAHPSPASSIFGDINKYAGTFLEITDAHGAAYITAYASAASSGAGWTRPNLLKPGTRGDVRPAIARR